MTTRSHDQYNTTLYGLDDRYRGVYGQRRVLFMNQQDIDAAGFQLINGSISKVFLGWG
jgi:anaerobic selenocysteine-containing dehydrogenase